MSTAWEYAIAQHDFAVYRRAKLDKRRIDFFCDALRKWRTVEQWWVENDSRYLGLKWSDTAEGAFAKRKTPRSFKAICIALYNDKSTTAYYISFRTCELHSVESFGTSTPSENNSLIQKVSPVLSVRGKLDCYPVDATLTFVQRIARFFRYPRVSYFDTLIPFDLVEHGSLISPEVLELFIRKI